MLKFISPAAFLPEEAVPSALCSCLEGPLGWALAFPRAALGPCLRGRCCSRAAGRFLQASSVRGCLAHPGRAPRRAAGTGQAETISHKCSVPTAFLTRSHIAG